MCETAVWQPTRLRGRFRDVIFAEIGATKCELLHTVEQKESLRLCTNPVAFFARTITAFSILVPPVLRQSIAGFALEPVPLMLNHFSGVMAGLVAPGLDPGAIHVFLAQRQQERRGCRDKRKHDGGEVIRSHRSAL